MGINNLLPNLPGGGPDEYHHSFYKALWIKEQLFPLMLQVLCGNSLLNMQQTTYEETTLLRWLNGQYFSTIYVLHANGI